MRLADDDVRDSKNETESSFLASAVGEILIFVHMVNSAEESALRDTSETNCLTVPLRIPGS
jgi:hypothetical protein